VGRQQEGVPICKVTKYILTTSNGFFRQTGVPVAIIRYDLNFDYYSPLNLLDDLEDWHSFLDRLAKSNAY